MNEEQANRMIELLESIDDKLSTIGRKLNEVGSSCDYISDKSRKLDDIEDELGRIRRNM